MVIFAGGGGRCLGFLAVQVLRISLSGLFGSSFGQFFFVFWGVCKGIEEISFAPTLVIKMITCNCFSGIIFLKITIATTFFFFFFSLAELILEKI